MKLKYPQKLFDSSYEPCEKCDRLSTKMCIREDDVALCIKERISKKWYPTVAFEVGKSYEISSVECDNTGQHAVYVKHDSDSRPHWFILKYEYCISGMGFRIQKEEPEFFEYFEITRLSRIKKLRKLHQITK